MPPEPDSSADVAVENDYDAAKMVEPARRRLGDDADLRVLFFVLDAG